MTADLAVFFAHTAVAAFFALWLASVIPGRLIAWCLVPVGALLLWTRSRSWRRSRRLAYRRLYYFVRP